MISFHIIINSLRTLTIWAIIALKKKKKTKQSTTFQKFNKALLNNSILNHSNL